MPAPTTMRKTITARIGDLASIGKFVYDISVKTGVIKFYHQKDFFDPNSPTTSS